MENLKLSTSFAVTSKDVVLVNIEGYVDQANCSQLESLFKDLKEDGCYKLIFDFTDLVYLSSAGWGVFVGEIKDFREHGGDIKLVNMNPQVYEVFQMLEFYHILNDYPTVEDALRAFNITMGKNNKTFIHEKDSNEIEVEEKMYSDNSNPDDINTSLELNIDFKDTIIPKKSALESIVQNETDLKNYSIIDIEKNYLAIDVSKLPLHEKIKKVVSQYPLLSIFKIKKMLSHEEFGHEKVNIFKLYSLLKKLNLETKKKRYRYWRSC